jgi:cytochrome P450
MSTARTLGPAPAGSKLRPIPGDGGLPVIGHTFRAMHHPLEMSRARYERYGPVSWTSLFGQRVVTLLGPDATGVALQNRDKAFANGPAWTYFIGPFFHRGIMLMDFDQHLQHRRIMQQAFTKERLSRYLAAMNPEIATGLTRGSTGAGCRVYPALKQLTLDLATRVFMGVDLGPEADRVNHAFVDCVRAGTAYLRRPVPGLRWSRGLAGRCYLEQFLSAQLPSKRAGEADDLFSTLCHAESEDGDRFTDDDVVSHMIFLMMAAHDTSTITMSTMAYYLAKHPDWQERCRDESFALGKEAVDHADLDRLVSLDLVMKEALRLVPPVPMMPRKAVKDTEVLGHFVPEGTMVSVGPFLTHHLPEIWPDPERFDPERFAEHRREDKVHKHAWEPFGGGVHKCIGMHFGGMEIKAVMHQVLQRYRWSVDPAYEMPIDWTSLPRPKDGLPVRLERTR